MTRRPRDEPVYNLEIHGEHVYHVGSSGVLVHNSYRHYGYADDAKLFKNGLRPGSYATHGRGRPMLGSTAKKKLSLPHQYPPDSYYKIKLNDNVPVVGPNPVKPEFGQPGGGIEFIFPNGTPPGSVTGPFPIN